MAALPAEVKRLTVGEFRTALCDQLNHSSGLAQVIHHQVVLDFSTLLKLPTHAATQATTFYGALNSNNTIRISFADSDPFPDDSVLLEIARLVAQTSRACNFGPAFFSVRFTHRSELHLQHDHAPREIACGASTTDPISRADLVEDLVPPGEDPSMLIADAFPTKSEEKS